jgi:hypothetical protein
VRVAYWIAVGVAWVSFLGAGLALLREPPSEARAGKSPRQTELCVVVRNFWGEVGPFRLETFQKQGASKDHAPPRSPDYVTSYCTMVELGASYDIAVAPAVWGGHSVKKLTVRAGSRKIVDIYAPGSFVDFAIPPGAPESTVQVDASVCSVTDTDIAWLELAKLGGEQVPTTAPVRACLAEVLFPEVGRYLITYYKGGLPEAAALAVLQPGTKVHSPKFVRLPRLPAPNPAGVAR